MTFVRKFADKIENFVIDSEVVDGTLQKMGHSVLSTPEKKRLIIQ